MPDNAAMMWAIHPAFMGEVTRGAVESLIPPGARAFLGMGPAEAAAAPDPIRDGGTAILPVQRTLSPRGEYGAAGNMAQLSARVRDLAADTKVGIIVLDIQSPGGLVWGTQEFGDAIYEARQSKPIIAVANSYAFSAAHWAATQASAYYASPSAEVGSVGVRMGHVDMSGFEEKIGFKTTLIASSPQKIAGHPYAPLSDEDRGEMEAQIATLNDAFVAAIARGRAMKAADVPAIHGQGQTYFAAQAAASGMIDGVMTLRDVVAIYSSDRTRLSLMRRRAEVLAQAATI
jgi:signal peptide peptidase SppA